jgi:hypothetical protein
MIYLSKRFVAFTITVAGCKGEEHRKSAQKADELCGYSI